MVGGVGCLLRNFGKYDRSYSQVIALALVKYFDLYYRTREDSYLETRVREERFVDQIIKAVEKGAALTRPSRTLKRHKDRER